MAIYDPNKKEELAVEEGSEYKQTGFLPTVAKALSTVNDTVVNMQRGMAQGVEGIGDFFLNLTGLFGNKEYKDWVQKKVAEDNAGNIEKFLFDNWAANPQAKLYEFLAEKANKAGKKDLAALLYSNSRKGSEELSYLNNTTLGEKWVDPIAQSIGGMILDAAIGGGVGSATGAIAGKVGSGAAKAASVAAKAQKVTGLATLGVRSAGNATGEAYNDGATYGRGTLYGLAQGGTEVATELMFDSPINKIYSSGFLRPVASTNAGKIIKGAAGEAIEEVASELASPLEKAIYKGNEAFREYGDGDYWKGVGRAGATGALTAGVVGTATGSYSHSNMAADFVNDAQTEITKRANQEANGKLDAKKEAASNKKIQTYMEAAEKNLAKMSEKQRAKFFEDNKGLSTIFTEDGKIRPEFARKTWGGQSAAETANGAQAQNAGLSEGQKRYVSVNARYDSERATNAVKALQENLDARGKGETAEIYSGEMTSEQEANYTIAKRIVNNINQNSGDDIALVVVGGNNDFNALNVKSGNAILISEKTLANTHGAVDALAKILFEEATHSTQTTDTSGRYTNAWYGVLFRELAANNSATMKAITSRLLANGNGYGFTQEMLESMEQKLDKNESLNAKEQELLDEIVAQTAGEVLGGNEEIIERYASNKSAAEKILGVFGKIKKALSRANSKEAKAERTRVERVEGMLLNALAEKGLTYQNGKVISVRPPEGKEGETVDNQDKMRYNKNGGSYSQYRTSALQGMDNIRFSRGLNAQNDGESGDVLEGLTQGQRKKVVANNTMDRVFTRIEAQDEINRIVDEVIAKKYGDTIIKGGRQNLVNRYWIDLNKSNGLARDAIANKIADYMIENAMVSQAVEEMSDDASATGEEIAKKAKRIRLDSIDSGELEKMRSQIANELLNSFDRLGSESTFSKNTRRKIKLSIWNSNIAKELQGFVDGKGEYVAADILNAPEMQEWIKTLKPLAGKAIYGKEARKVVEQLSKFYNEDNELLEGYLDENVEDAVKFILEKKDSKAMLSTEEMEALHKILAGIRRLYKTYDRVTLAGRSVSLTDTAMTAHEQISKARRKATTRSFAGKLKNLFSTEMVEPRVVIEALEGFTDDGILSKAYRDIQNGETRKQILYMQMMYDFDEFMDKNKKYGKRLYKDYIEFHGQKLSVGQAITLHELAKRDQAKLGLSENGFTFDDEKNVKHSIKAITDDELSTLSNQFTEQDKEFIKITEHFFNEVASEIKMEADKENLGYTNALEEFYFPIARDKMTIRKAITDTRSMLQNMISLYSYSFNKDVRKNAKNALYVGNVYDIIKTHAEQLSSYAGLYAPMKSFEQIYGKNIAKNKGLTGVISVRQTLNDNVWDGTDKYISKLMSDISGTTPTEKSEFVEYLRGAYAKFQLGANVKTFLSQIASYPQAFTELDMGSLVKGFATVSNHADMDKYCPYASVRNYNKGIVKAEGVIDKIGKVGDTMTKPIQVFDQFTIGKLWNACQYQVQKDSGLKIGTEENKVKAGAMLEDVIRKTQPDFNTSERSALMRSQSEYARAAVMFTSAQLKQLSRLVESVGKLQYAKTTGDAAKIKAARIQVARSSSAVLMSVTAYAMMGMLAKALFARLKASDKEPEEKFEAIAKEFGADMISGGVGLLPIVRDIYSAISSKAMNNGNGYEINSFYYDVLNNVVNAGYKAGELAVHAMQGKNIEDYQYMSVIRNTTNAVGQLTGVPTRNLYNEITGLIKRVSPSAGYTINSKFYNANYVSDMNKALESGDEQRANTIMNLMMSERMDGTSTSQINKSVLDLYKKGYTVLPRTVGDSITYDGQEYKLTARQKARFQKVYGQASAAVQKVVSLQSYRKLSDEVKAKTIKRIYDMYYNLAIDDLLGTDTEDKTVLFSYAIDPDKLALIIAQAQSLQADTDKNGNAIAGSKKQKVVAYISGLKLTAAQKYMIMGYLGYRNAKGEEQVKSYINRLPGLSKAEKKTLMEYSGY